MEGLLKPYQDYKASGTSWLGDIPEHWEVRSLKQLGNVTLSSVDKHVLEGEEPVRLCNYVDVYKRDFIHRNLPFMEGSATSLEIKRFSLKPGDVLITKDSEMWNDIGVPALVSEEVPGVVCGYHLALIRPEETMQGAYLFRALKASPVAQQLHVAANGVTRFGISKHAIKNALLPAPPADEQVAISTFLAAVDAKIARFIATKRQLITLLNEHKLSIAHQVVTRGLDPGVLLKPSSVPWLGEMPAHWEVRRGKHLFREVDERSVDGHEELLSVSHITGVTPRTEKNITMFKAASYAGHKIARPGDIVVNTMWAWMAALGVSRYEGIVSPSYATYRCWKSDVIDPTYLDFLLRLPIYRSIYHSRSTGIRSSRLRLYPDQFLDVPFLVPPFAEQTRIVDQLLRDTASLTQAVDRANHEIALIHEYRSRLIDEVVTGKIDVREAAASLPTATVEDLTTIALDDDEDMEPFEETELDEVGEEVVDVAD